MNTLTRSYLFRKKVSVFFFKFLEKNKIDYCYLGNSSHFPTKIQTDVDIFINFKNTKDLKKILLKFVKYKKLKIVNFIQYEFNSFLIKICNISKNNTEHISFDICNEYVLESRKIINLKKIKKKSLIKKNFTFKVLPVEYEFFYYLLKKIYKNDIDIRSFLYLKKNFNSSKNFEYIEFFSREDFNLLKQIFKSKGIKLFKEYRDYFKKKFIDSRRFFLFKEFMRYCTRISNKTGLHIVFLGCDGSGKTSQINFLVNSNIINIFRGYSIYHLFTKSFSKNRVHSLPYQYDVYNPILSFVKILYLYLRFFFNYFFALYRKIISSKLVINDRYYQDVIIDPKRYRIGSFISFLNFIFKFLPTPDLVIILDTKLNSLVKRKQEFDIKKIKNLTLKYKDYVKKDKNCHLIKSDNTIENINKKIINLIVKHKTLL